MIKVYTDGAYSSKRKQGGWAFVIIGDDDKIIATRSGYDNTEECTNNRMELTAILRALDELDDRCIIDGATLYSDSQYCIGEITKGWKRNKNEDLLEIIDNYLLNLQVNFEYVAGHQDNKFNNLCDEYAVKMSKYECN